VYYRKAEYCCAVSSVGKRLNAKDVHKEMFPVYDEKCLSRTAAHKWVEKFIQGRSKVADDARTGAEWLRQQSKDFYAAGFDAIVKRWDKCINVGVGYVENMTCFTFYIHL
jgi:hypothetical protein